MTREDSIRSDDFRNRLVELTVRSARRLTTFYKMKLGDTKIRKGFSIEDLSDLPLVTKQEMHENEKEWADSNHVCAVQNTSGSTGTPLFIYRTSSEFAFIDKFFSMVDKAPLRSAPVGLHLPIPQHGVATPIPCHAFILQGAVSTDKLLRYSASLITKQFSVPHLDSKVSFLSGDHNSILLLSNYFDGEPTFRKDADIRAICLTGRLLTSRWTNKLSKIWNSEIIDRFTLSEVFGGATRCWRCQGYHFDPHVVAEIVPNPRTDPRAIREGSGFLVLTALAPFVWNQPFIRYLTDDIFVVKQTECVERSYFPLGRASQTLFASQLGIERSRDTGDAIVLPGRELIDVLDATANIVRAPTFRDVTIADAHDIGFPLFRGMVVKEGAGITLRLELGAAEAHEAVIEAEKVRSDSFLYPLAVFLLKRCSKYENIRVVLALVPRERLSSVEKNTVLWVDRPQK